MLAPRYKVVTSLGHSHIACVCFVAHCTAPQSRSPWKMVLKIKKKNKLSIFIFLKQKYSKGQWSKISGIKLIQHIHISKRKNLIVIYFQSTCMSNILSDYQVYHSILFWILSSPINVALLFQPCPHIVCCHHVVISATRHTGRYLFIRVRDLFLCFIL